MTEKAQRKILIYKNCFENFYSRQSKEVQKNIDETVGLVQDLKIIPEKIFRKIENTDGLYEIIIETGIRTIQIFCFLDGEDLIIIQTGFRNRFKKQRDDEIEKAKKLRKEYFGNRKGK